MNPGIAEAETISLHLLQLTDPHLFADERELLAGVNTVATWRSVLARVRETGTRPDAVLVTGDLVHDRQEASYLRLRDDLQELGAPVYVLPGNHDDVAMLRRVFPEHGRVCWTPRVMLGGWLLVMLDSTVPGSPGGHLAQEELDRLEAALCSEPQRPTLVALHHQPVPMGSEWIDTIGVDNGGALMELLQRHPQVRVVLWGHVHQELDRLKGGLRLLATPSTCIQFRPGQRQFGLDDRAPGWRHLRLDGDGAVTTWVERLERLPAGLDLDMRGY